MLPFRSRPTRLWDPDDTTSEWACLPDMIRGLMYVIANRGMQVKLSHVVSLAEGLLPLDGQMPGLTGEMQALIDGTDDSDEDEDELEDRQLSLRALRQISLQKGRHGHCWRQMVEPSQFKVGDFG